MIIVDDFGPGGVTLWAELHEDGDPVETTVLVQEACRVTDRLDRLNAAIRTGGIFDLVESDGGVVEVRVDNALSEARLQANTLRLLLNDIARRRQEAKTDDDGDDPLDSL